MKLALCPNCCAVHTPPGLVVDEASGVVSWPCGSMRLSRGQLPVVFAHLLRRRPAVVSRETLLDQVYGLNPNGPPEASAKAVDVWIWKLRQAMRRAGFPGEVRSHWGRGYELIVHPLPQQADAQHREAVE